MGVSFLGLSLECLPCILPSNDTDALVAQVDFSEVTSSSIIVTTNLRETSYCVKSSSWVWARGAGIVGGIVGASVNLVVGFGGGFSPTYASGLLLWVLEVTPKVYCHSCSMACFPCSTFFGLQKPGFEFISQSLGVCHRPIMCNFDMCKFDVLRIILWSRILLY